VQLSNDGATAEFGPPVGLTSPTHETAALVVEAPKEVPRPTPTNPLIRFLPVVTALATVAAMAIVFRSGLGGMRNPAFMLFPVMMLVSAVAAVASAADRRGGEINTERTQYLSYLSALHSIAAKSSAAQHHWLNWRYPDPDALWTLVGGRLMWERRTPDPDFCHVRVGIGSRRRASRLVTPTIDSAHHLDPVTVSAMKRFVETHSTVADVPIAVGLSGTVSVVGETTRVRALVRGMICHLAVMHSPQSVLIAAVVTDHSRSEWDWLKWLPHNRHPRAHDDVGPVRLVHTSLTAAKQALSEASVDQRLMVVIDDGTNGVTVLSIQNGDNSATAEAPRLHITGDTVVAELSSGEEVSVRADQMSYASALACAQRLAGYRASVMDAAASDDVGWQDLVGIGDLAAYSPADRWNGRHSRDRLRVPIGTTAEGAPVELDIKEAAESGMGPHGLCIGATGSGKSELLRTVALGMIASHSPEALNLVLIDFKGGATFAGLETAPHVAAVITNLSDKAALVTRMRDALTGEMNRRQELLRSAGNFEGVAAYERARGSRPQLNPLPALFIIVDEFSELLSQHPDFAEVFVAIGRLGRSLAMHLLLASQRLDEGRLRGLESHLSYRLCLKTLSVNESRIVLGTSDAYELPSTPGAAYLRVGTDELFRFQTAYVSGPCQSETPCGDVEYGSLPRADMRVRLFTTEPVGMVTLTDNAAGPVGDRPTVLQTVVERLSRHGPRAHEVWLPPLGASPPLDVVLADAGLH